MRSLPRFFIRLVNTMTRQRDDAPLNDEIEEHLALETAENIRLLRLEPPFSDSFCTKYSPRRLPHRPGLICSCSPS
jgi:hypothetical protein